MSAVDECLAANQRYAAGDVPRGLATGPRRGLAVVTCMDSRIDVFGALGLALGEAHIIRNAGGVVTDDVIRSLVVSQRLLATVEIFVIQHTRCGLLGVGEEELRRRVEVDVGVRPPFSFETFDNLEVHLRQSLRRVRISPYLQHRDAVRGAVYDVDSHRLHEVV